ANAQKLHKIRGGAEALSEQTKAPRPSLAGSVFQADRERHTRRKRMIAKKAAALCEDGDSITINGGSSTFMMGEFLTRRNLSILTNSFELAHFLIENSDNQVSLPGGEIYRKQSIVVSSFENDSIENYHTSKMFMGTPGIGEFGVMESDPLLIKQEQRLMRQARQLVVLADSTKLGNRSNFVCCPLSDVDILITDSDADESQLKLFRDNDIEVIVVTRDNEQPEIPGESNF
ncbi:MAG: DeoR/GlpR transcriptional regulator, partial [Woeseiaceae bacterium]|nr:DeoR/GlpR transcriptional regulator [Woeseiaceae bacterium]